jgi:hypothetical protein
MSRRMKLARTSMCKRICELAGVQLKSSQGYFSRGELLELYDYLKRVQETCRILNKITLHSTEIQQTIVDGKIYHEPKSRG